MMCKYGKTLFKIDSVKINGAAADTTKFPELSNSQIEMNCFNQAAEELKAKPNKKVSIFRLIDHTRIPLQRGATRNIASKLVKITVVATLF